MKTLSLIILLFLLITNCFAQQNKAIKEKTFFNKTVVFGSSVTVIPDNESVNGISKDARFTETTWALNLQYDVTNHYRAGIDVKNIFTAGQLSGKNHYYMVGLTNQWKFFHTKNTFTFLELAPYLGNYCTCGDDNPYKKNGLVFLNAGAGINIKLAERLRLDLAFHSASILNKQPGKYNFTQYIIGLDYLFYTKKYANYLRRPGEKKR
ncbi:MAG: hypothetical protein SFU21_04885 [Flavihumibacter sp.]|nr:hypothetical protein [Flavihumibacter sp.]